jgi:hypothetical protein
LNQLHVLKKIDGLVLIYIGIQYHDKDYAKMSSAIYEEQYAALVETQKELQQKIEELQSEKAVIVDKLDALKKQQLETNEGLSKKDTLDLRRSLTIVGESLSKGNVIFGTVHLVDSEPIPTDRGYMGDVRSLAYSYEMNCEMVMDFAMGYKYTVTIRTQNPAVRTIVRHMLRQQGYVDDSQTLDGERTEWVINWDYYQSIELIDPLSDNEYYEQCNKSR